MARADSALGLRGGRFGGMLPFTPGGRCVCVLDEVPGKAGARDADATVSRQVIKRSNSEEIL